MHRAADRGVHARRLRRGVGPRRAVGTARPDLPGGLRRRTSSTARASTARELKRPRRRGRDEALRRARAGARRGADARARALPAAADHRPALARAPLRHGLPARGHPPPRLRPDRPARRLQERGLHALPGPDEHHLVRLRAHDLQRRGRGARARRRRAADEQLPPGSGARPRPLSYSGGTLEDQPSAYGGEGYAVEADPSGDGDRRPAPRCSSAASTSTSRSAATSRAGAGRARSTRSATAHER